MSTAADDHDASYILTFEEVGSLAREAGKPAKTLMNVVALITNRFQSDVCSVYLLEPDRATLVLAATLGLRSQCIGTLRMALHEGLAGLVAEEVRPVAVKHVRNHPRLSISVKPAVVQARTDPPAGRADKHDRIEEIELVPCEFSRASVVIPPKWSFRSTLCLTK